MAASTDMQGLQAAWRALGGSREGQGWKTIPVSASVPCTLLAGRHMPGDEEAILVGLGNIKTIPDFRLPQGHGFEVSWLPADPTGGNRLWVALMRRTSGSLEFFTVMAEDLVHLLEEGQTQDEDGLLRRLLSRIRAWQDFMDRPREGVLAPDAELGLFGELVLLSHMIEAGMPAKNVLDCWQGPLDGLQDFVPGSGGIEVKATLSIGGFPATISSLEQLDDSLRKPLFLAAVRLTLDAEGMPLPTMANTIRETLHDDQVALDVFEIRLVQAGLLRTAARSYSRRFLHASTSILPVCHGFPRLTRADVHTAIRKARYEIDLDLAGALDVGLSRALQLLGAI